MPKVTASVISTENFKKLLIIMWALWWLNAFWTDAMGGLLHLGIVHGTWMSEENYLFLVASLAMYSVASWFPPILFVCIILWSGLSTAVFFWACFALKKNSVVWKRRAEIAYIVSLTFWLAFFVADQIVMKYTVAENHMVQGGFELLSFFALYILP